MQQFVLHWNACCLAMYLLAATHAQQAALRYMGLSWNAVLKLMPKIGQRSSSSCWHMLLEDMCLDRHVPRAHAQPLCCGRSGGVRKPPGSKGSTSKGPRAPPPDAAMPSQAQAEQDAASSRVGGEGSPLPCAWQQQ